ncbi:MAG: GNAT family N-acetyltransferase [Alphaproteobacteria bacterium]|nr:GNAT family N-acetyltransferase [Alphaproteobacteria bacterium]
MRRTLEGPIEAPSWPTGVSVRTFRQADAEAAHSVLQSGFWEGGGGATTFRRWWSELRKDDEFDPGLFYIVEDGQGVAGMVQCWTSAFVKDLAVLPRLRRRGIGRALMLTAFDAFKTRGADHVDLKVNEENIAAQRLYHSLGMQVVERLAA